MMIKLLPLVENNLSSILEKVYPHLTFMIFPEPSGIGAGVNVAVRAYLRETFDILDNTNTSRRKFNDLELRLGEQNLVMSGRWRNSLLTLTYGCDDAYEWTDDKDKTISRPYPDGEEFEKIAAEFYPIYLDAINGKV